MAVSISISITQNSQSIANNTSNVTCKVTASWTGGSYNYNQKSGYLTIDGTKYTFTSSFNTGETTTGSAVIYTKTLNISHAADGTKTLACYASYTTGVSSGTVTASASKALTTIPRKSTLSVANGTLGTAQTLTVTRQASSFTHTIVATCGSASTTICTKSSSTSVNFTPPISWSSQNTTGTTVSVEYTITTYNGNSSVGSNRYTKSCSIPSSVKPSCTVAISDPTGFLSTYGAYIKGYSKFAVVITPTLSYNSAIASYKATANGSTYTSASFTTGLLKSSGTLTVSATVTDKRGRSSNSAQVTATVLNYAAPVISKLTVGRCDADGTANDKGEYAIVTYEYSISDLNSQNSATAVLKYKKTSDTEYTTPSDFVSATSGSYIFAADTGSSYDIVFTVTDKMDATTKTTSVSTAYTIMHWKSSGYGMAIGKISELDNVFDVGMQTRMLGGILHPVLEPDTDLNDVRTPNTYVGANLITYNYLNCPLDSGTFTLEVVGMGDQGQVKQRLTWCHKTQARTWERIYYESAWGNWICVSDISGSVLWKGGWYMTAEHTATLSEPISHQKNGIVLVFSECYDGSVVNSSYHCRFVPKKRVTLHPGIADCIQLSTSNLAYFATKYLYIYDDKIVGHNNNMGVGTGSTGITYNNQRFVLRYVIGV